jgi:hypothetical protein
MSCCSRYLMGEQEQPLCDKVENESTEHCGANHDGCGRQGVPEWSGWWGP